MSNSSIKASHSGEIKIGDLTIPCHILKDGSRVISSRGTQKAVGLSSKGGQLFKLGSLSALQPFFPESFIEALNSPKYFQSAHGGRVGHGYDATVLVDFCTAILDAFDAGMLPTNQQHLVVQCQRLVRAFAKTGLIALVDEATGYQKERESSELQNLHTAYLRQFPRQWEHKFPSDLWIEIARLRGWRSRPTEELQKIRANGKLINEIFYKRLPGDIGQILGRLNPTDETNHRRYVHHSFLTEDFGDPHLGYMIRDSLNVMRGYPDGDWTGFMKHWNKIYPC